MKMVICQSQILVNSLYVLYEYYTNFGKLYVPLFLWHVH